MRTKLFITLLILITLTACRPEPAPAPEQATEPATATIPTIQPTNQPTNTPAPTPTPPPPFPPLALQTSPQRGEEVSDDAPVEITFDQPMDRASVEEAFAISPPVEGELVWANDMTVRFEPAEAYQRGRRYKASVAESAAAAGGLPLNRAVEIPFTVAGYLEVTQAQPQDGATGIAPDTVVTALFNRPVVPLAAIEDLASLPQPLTFVPPITGEGEWLNTSIYRFTPDEGFEPSTQYTARISGGLTDVGGGALEDDYVWRFTTDSPRVVATYPDDGSIYVSPTPVISVAFNQLMDRKSVEQAFIMLDAFSEKPVSGSFAWVEGGLTQPRDPFNDYYYYDYAYDDGAGPAAVGVETMAFTPDEPLALETPYLLQIDATARGRQGNRAEMEAPYSFMFNTIPNFEIAYTYPADGEDQADPFQSLEITFSAPADPASIRIGQNVLISPSVAVTRVYTYFWDSNSVMNLNFPTKASSAYTVTLLGDIYSRYGQPLGVDQTIQWGTRASDPSLYLHRPGDVGTYSAYTPTLAYVTVRNVSAVDFNLYALSQEDFIKLNGNDRWDARRNYRPPADDLIRSWRLEIAPPLNQNIIYGTNIAGEEGAILEPGLYYLQTDVRAGDIYPEARDNVYKMEENLILVVSNHNLTVKSGAEESLAWLTDLRTTEPVEGAAIRFLTEDRNLGQRNTDEQGAAKREHRRADPWQPRFFFSDDPFAAAIGEWSDGVERWQYGLSTEDYLQPLAAHFYTDRAIYRPGQTVYFKGVIREDNDAHYTLPPKGDEVQIIVYDARGKEIFSDDYALNENGTLHGEIELAGEAALGYYFIEAFYGNRSFSSDFQVAEYRKPEFVVDVTTDKPEYVNGDLILLTAQANYFFGGAVANADVVYNILSDDYFFNYTGPGGYYDFTDYDYSRSANFVPGFGELIEQGTGTTDADGTFTLEVSADIAERSTSQRFTLEVTVVDSDSNQEVSNRAEAIVHKGDFYIGLRPQKYVSQAGEESAIDLLTVDWESLPAGKQNLTVIVYEHNWYSVKVEADDGSAYWESVVEDVPVYTTTVTTNAQGQAEMNVIPKNGGVHKIEATGVDDNGNIVRSSTFMWISGSSYINWRQENNDRIELVTDKKEYEVGDTATILIPHPYSGTVTALVTQERGHIYDYNVITLETNSEQIKIPITAGMLPNMFISVVIVKGPDENNPIPSFKVGYAQLPISVKEKEINITLTPDKPAGENYQPGDDVTYEIIATDFEGNPVEAEFSLALIDKAVLSLADDTGGTLLERFWRERGLGVSTASGLAISAERVNLAVAPEAKGGGGGGFEDAFGVIRGEFKDTAYWLADFTTDENGRGSVTATLPDNLTTWVLTARGVSKDTLVGDERVEIISTKPLLVRPIAPRFFVIGDEAQLRMVVQNNTAEDLTVTTLFEGEGVLLLDGKPAEEVDVEAGGKATLYYPIKVGVTEEATLRFGARRSAVGGQRSYEDAVEITLPVYRFSTPETVGTSGVLIEDGFRLEAIALPERYDPTQGHLTVNIEPSLAAGMRDSLDYLEHFPYECTEQTVSRFLPNIFTYRAYLQLDLDNPELADRLPGLVSTGLQRLYAQQNIDGGWGWWSGDDSQSFLTAYVLLGLVEAERSGFAVDEQVVENAIAFLGDNLRRPNDVERSWEANRQAFVLYALAEAGAGDLGRTVSLYDQREKLDLFGRAYLAMAFALLEPKKTTRVDTLLSDITGEAIVSATGAHWEESRPDYFNMNTDTRSAAIIIAALSRLDPENALLPNAVRWLMSVREGGTWETTQEASWAIIGLTDWMIATGELDGNYNWAVNLNGDELGAGSVGPENIDEITTLQVAVQDLLAGEINRLIIDRFPQEGDAASNGRLYYTAHLEYYKPVAEVKALDRGIVIARQYSLADAEGAVSEAKIGDIINVKLTIIAPNDLHYVKIEDPIPAGSEAIDRSLNISSVVGEQPGLTRTDGWGWRWFSHTELRDEKAVIFATFLPKGTYEYTYQIRPSLPGEYRVIPTYAEQMYFPEVFGRGDGAIFTITE